MMYVFELATQDVIFLIRPLKIPTNGTYPIMFVLIEVAPGHLMASPAIKISTANSYFLESLDCGMPYQSSILPFTFLLSSAN